MTTYYLLPTGNNANTGLSTAQAWQTLTRAGSAASVVTRGDFVMLCDGTYSVSSIATAKAGTSGNPVTYKAVTPLGAKIVGTAADDTICWTNTGAFVVVDGLDLMTHGRLGIYFNANDCELKNSYIHDILYEGTPTCGNGGAGTQSTGNRWSVHHNLICRVDQARAAGPCWPTSNGSVHGIYLAGGSSATIYNNIVADIVGYGIHAWHGTTTEFIYNNSIMDCGHHGIIIGAGDSGELPDGNRSARVYNNVILNCTSGAIRELGRVSACTYVNNMIFGCGLTPVDFDATDVPFTDGIESGRISASPSFVNYISDGSGDYHLSAGSLAIGAANTLYVASDDYFGTARPQGGTYDVGAAEFVASDTTAPILTSPSGASTGQTTATGTVTTDEGNGTLYCWITTNTTETVTNIIASGNTTAVASTGIKALNIPGLTAGTTYYAHFTQIDAAGNTATASNSISFTTDALPGINIPTVGGHDRKVHRRH